VNYRKIFFQVSLLTAFLLLALVITIWGRKKEYISIAGFTQGTTYHITYESKKGEQYQSKIDSLLSSFDMSLSIYEPASIISRFNRNVSGTVADDKFTTVFFKSLEVNKETSGAFDITVGPIVNALGFGSSDTINVDSTMIDSLLAYIGMNKVQLSNGKLVKSDPHVTLDVNAIAQGYAVDLVADFLEKQKIRNYMVEIGGEVRAKGKNDRNQIWRIGIDRPVEGNMMPGANLQAIVALKNKSLATSGNYRKFYVKNGIKFVHTINPKSGYPVVSNLLSATVVAKDCMTADAYATAMMVFGVDKSIAFLKEHDFLNAFLIYADEQGRFQVYVTPGLKKALSQ
jgi:thiamine biosynthesis lipoprotein